MSSRGQTHCILPTVALPHDGWHTEIQDLHIHMILFAVYVHVPLCVDGKYLGYYCFICVSVCLYLPGNTFYSDCAIHQH